MLFVSLPGAGVTCPASPPPASLPPSLPSSPPASLTAATQPKAPKINDGFPSAWSRPGELAGLDAPLKFVSQVGPLVVDLVYYSFISRYPEKGRGKCLKKLLISGCAAKDYCWILENFVCMQVCLLVLAPLSIEKKEEYLFLSKISENSQKWKCFDYWNSKISKFFLKGKFLRLFSNFSNFKNSFDRNKNINCSNMLYFIVVLKQR